MEHKSFTALFILISLCVSWLGALAPTAATQSNATVSIDPVLTYLLPAAGFAGNVSDNFIDTMTNDSNIAGVLSAAKKAFFISYDPEFLEILGDNPSLKLIEQRDELFADEGGAWDPVKNQVWFASATVNNAGNISVLDLSTSKVFTPNTSIPIVTPNGGYYFDGKVYFTGQGTATVAPNIYEIDPTTYETKIIINSYFGLRFGGPNDLVWVKRGNKKYLFFTDDPQSYYFSTGQYPVLPDAVWRYDPQEQSIVPVVSRADVLIPNGIYSSADMTKIYVTDTPADAAFAPPGWQAAESPAIYSFDIDEDLLAGNKRLIGITRSGISDGIKVDDKRRVWTGEGEGIVVRNSKGKVIGVFNSETLLASPSPQLANFALAGDTLVILAMQRLWTLKLAQTVVSPDRYHF